MNLLYIDLFCGAGGTSTGVNSARFNGEQCAKVIACVNHDKNAIASHAANHPDALHFTEDIRTLELSPLVAHIEKCKEQNPNAVIVLWASLECTNFSKAKGGQPRPEDYVLVGTQAEQKKYIGNAVEVTIARVWCEALVKKIIEVKKVA